MIPQLPTHGLIAILKQDKVTCLEDMEKVLFFRGYYHKPNEEDILDLFIDLRDNKSFELQDKVNNINIIEPPKDILHLFGAISIDKEIIKTWKQTSSSKDLD